MCMTEFMEIIQTVGFPIAMCVGFCYWFINKDQADRTAFTKLNDSLYEALNKSQEINKAHALALKDAQETIEEQRKSIQQFNEFMSKQLDVINAKIDIMLPALANKKE